MDSGRQCKFGNDRCMCLFCQEPCNNGLTCYDCERAGEAVHSVYLCTGFTGSVEEYLENWRKNQQEKK